MLLSSVLSLDGVPYLEKWFGQFTGRMWKQDVKWQHLPPNPCFSHQESLMARDHSSFLSRSAQHWQPCLRWPCAGSRHDCQKYGSIHLVFTPRS